MDLIYFLLIGAAAGWLAGKFMKGAGFGAVGNVILGILGGIVGGFLFDKLGLAKDGSLLGSLVTAFAGAVVLLWVAGLLSKK